MQNSKNTVENFMRLFEAALPDGLTSAVRDNLRAASTRAFEKLDLVSNEEFEVQKRVLLKTREKLEELEKKVEQLEKQKNS
jgi:BMFP domain-containing protein YqiC